MSKAVDLAGARERAVRVAARAEIRDVRLFKTTAEMHKAPDLDFGLSYDLDSDVELIYDEGDTHFVVEIKYSLKVRQRDRAKDDDGDEEDSEVVAEVDFKQGGLFELEMEEGEELPAQDELVAFAQSTGQFALYPFARQYIYDITGRLGLPPLTLGVLRIPIDKSELD